jgi:predicted MPP superfamily phosphohydrolase
MALPLPQCLPTQAPQHPALVAVQHQWVDLTPLLPKSLPLGAMHEPLLVSHHTLRWPHLPPACHGMTLAHLTDIHLSWPTLPWLQALSQWLATQPYDVLALTGDVITSGDAYLPQLREWLQSLPQGKPTVASMGNHDYEDGDHGRSLKALYRDLGIRCLVNETVGLTPQGILHNPELTTLSDALWVLGVDDAVKGRPDVDLLQSHLASKPLESAPALLLCHNPYLIERVPHWAGVGLILAGHTHGGQWADWPVPMAWVAGSNYLQGLYTLPPVAGETPALLHVNHGLGTACLTLAGRTLPVPRLLVRPQVSFWTLLPEVDPA